MSLSISKIRPNSTIDRNLPVLVLLSGGIDSTACVHYYLSHNYSVSALFVDYGQPQSNKEAQAAAAISEFYQIRLQTYSIIGLKVSEGYVRARNALLLSLGLMHFQHESGLLALGIHSGTEYADCTPEFLAEMEKLFVLYESGRIRIDAPFLLWSKHDIWLYANSENVPLHLSYTSNPNDVRSF